MRIFAYVGAEVTIGGLLILLISSDATLGLAPPRRWPSDRLDRQDFAVSRDLGPPPRRGLSDAAEGPRAAETRRREHRRVKLVRRIRRGEPTGPSLPRFRPSSQVDA
jgi:hypothetical protein